LKRRLLIALLALAALVIGWIVCREITYRRASYQGKHIRDWAVELYSSYEPRGTNAPAIAFRAMSSNAVPTLRSLLDLRDPVYEKALLKYARYIPTKPRIYLFQKLKPGRAIEYRLGAIRALGVIGPAAIDALPDLLETLQDSDTRLRWITAQTLPQLGPEAVTALIPLLTNADASLRHAAVYSLGEARPNALPAVPALIRCTMDTNESVRASALYSLSRVGFAAVPKALEIAATETDPLLQNAAFRSLVALRPPPGRVLTSHLMISTNSPEIRRMALMTLWVSRQTNQHALKLFEGGLKDEDLSVRELAQKILDRLNSTNRGRLFPL
jgi:HEAT repeat protein